ncbi:uncharacterized protein BJ212DRAFT_1356341 [Suillus subaureus]|uniref:RING-type domain-containing protein n=1 Tax=Suillus subaureus TaxID=48587 RepID=A0A9P7JDI9_9AGAM|nr:uncharacterized protein BJ212DRAFT_1356341 [Suillus subaureus]KAG1816088.1 hypothetical protein BJ212DRAFT_1356341 [Suillus subaureus]
MLFHTMLLHILLSVLSSLMGSAYGYIPAQPSNDTSQINGMNASRLILQWYPNGSDWEYVSYQLVGAGSNGTTKGALVHFTESLAMNESTTTPWIALISCDANSTNFSENVDIFTMASSAGAQSALLYSLYSNTCLINQEYADPANFDQVFDIFSTQSQSVSRNIQYEFGQDGPKNLSLYGNFDATTLNASATTISQSIMSGYPTVPGYLLATLQAWNATGTNSTGTSSNNNGSTSSTTNEGGKKETGLAMIILYAITGCVSALFCVVIISGAVRALRHPERYGPRIANGDPHGGRGGSQSRASGLGRAILDTFPIVRFGTAPDATYPSAKDVESPPVDADTTLQQSSDAVEMGIISSQAVQQPSQSVGETNERYISTTGATVNVHGQEDSQSDARAVPRLIPPRLPATSEAPPSSARDVDPLMPEAIGHETCPICIVDFEEGDELRVLPCEGKHRFHQTCVDPWLLELSGSCPLCRQDFHALETMLSGDAGDRDALSVFPSNRRVSQAPSMQQNRFSRYLRSARRRHRELGGNDDDTVDPSVATTVDHSL